MAEEKKTLTPGTNGAGQTPAKPPAASPDGDRMMPLSAQTETAPAVSNEKGYAAWLRNDLRQTIDLVDDLTPLQKRYLHSRWLDQVIWMEGKASTFRNRYYLLRMITIIGGILVPALVGLNLSANQGSQGGLIQVDELVYWTIFIISLTVSITTAFEEFFKNGERWRHYRSTVEELKVIGWQFFQLGGRFKDYDGHTAAFPSFVTAMEEIMQKDVQIFVSNINPDADEQKEKKEQEVQEKQERGVLP